MRYKDLQPSKTAFSKGRYEDGSTPYYHGTMASFEGVPNNPEHSGIYGRGVYLSHKQQRAAKYGDNVYEYRIEGLIGTEKDLDRAIAMASEEGLRASARYHRATDILLAHGFIGIEDYDVIVVYDNRYIRPV